MDVTRTARRITDEAELRRIIGGGPTELVRSKISDHLTPLTRRFVELSPFVCLASAGGAGAGLDVSPRGDPPGFVRILDERTLLLPERPGNRIADALRNLLRDDRIALLFLIPGVGDTFRVNGTAFITDDSELLAGSAVDGKPPRLGLVIAVTEAYTQCPKAFIRSALWDPARFADRAALPSGGEILRELAAERAAERAGEDGSDDPFDAAGYDAERAARYARGEGLY